MIFRLNAILLLLWLMLLPTRVWADLPLGHHEIPFISAQGIWDLSGNYNDSAGTTTIDFTILQDEKGKITGAGTGTTSQSGFDFDLDFTIVGSIKTIAQATRVQLKLRVSGEATDGSRTFDVTGNLVLKLDLDRVTNLLTGTVAGQLCLNRSRCGRGKENIELPVPPSEDGGWTLILDLQSADGKKVVGTGEARLDNGRTLPLDIGGQYKSTTDVTALKTVKGSAGQVTLRLTAEAGQIMIQKFSATLFGQKVNQ